MRLRAAALLALLVLAALPAPAQEVKAEIYTLPNGLTVILHEDHSLPRVTLNTWFGVGSKDEAPGRSGFAHLFEHLMFMGTARVPEGQFDQLMERGGGANNASTSTDRTNYYSWGPSSLLPTLLWLDADRLEGLGKAMTQEKLDLQRNVVRNERRQGVENAPYGCAELAIAQALYPPGHPYHHTVIGSHEDLEAATVEDVKAFFAAYYVPANASLVVAGDFDSAAVKPLIEKTFGAVPASPVPSHFAPTAPRLAREVRRSLEDRVQFPKLYLVWASPARYADGDAAMDVAATLLSEGGSGRLYRRLVFEERLAQSVDVYQESRELGSEFHIEVLASEGADVARIKAAVLEELERLKGEGPTEAEVARAKAGAEAAFLRRVEDLERRADMMNGYYHYFGTPDGFRRDLGRTLALTPAQVRTWCAQVLGDGRLDLRVVPKAPLAPTASLDQRPADFPAAAARLPVPVELPVADGLRLLYLHRPGSGLFAGALVAPGGERGVPPEKAGLASLAATLLTKGAGGRDAAAFADAASALGARVTARADWVALRVQVSGLSSKLDPTLDLFADAVLRPTLSEKDFGREKQMALDAIRARAEEPQQVASLVARALLYGKEDPRGRPASGYARTVEGLTRADVAGALPSLLRAGGAALVFAGDVEPEVLRAALARRFAGWKPAGPAPAPPPPVSRAAGGRLVLVERPGAPQTLLWMARPLAPADEGLRVQRECLNTLFGGSFTSRLNQNIRERHGFSYGARSAHMAEADQWTLVAFSPVQTAVTGAALTEFRREFDALASGDISAAELEKARRSVRYDLVDSASTTASLSALLTGLVADGRPLDEVQRLLAALDGVTLEGLNGRARGGDYAWDSLLVVLVGDKAQVLPQLKAAGFPEPQVVDIEGTPVPGP